MTESLLSSTRVDETTWSRVSELVGIIMEMIDLPMGPRRSPFVILLRFFFVQQQLYPALRYVQEGTMQREKKGRPARRSKPSRREVNATFSVHSALFCRSMIGMAIGEDGRAQTRHGVQGTHKKEPDRGVGFGNTGYGSKDTHRGHVASAHYEFLTIACTWLGCSYTTCFFHLVVPVIACWRPCSCVIVTSWSYGESHAWRAPRAAGIESR
jgi:hypothetical protein